MKQILTTVLVFTFISAFAQKLPQGLIYSCETKINGVSQYHIFNSSGQKIISQSVDWAYSNTWSWVFVMDKKTKLRTAFSYYGQQLVDSIEESQSTYFSSNRVGLKRNGKWGFYDKQGKLKIAHLYDEISRFKNNIAAIKIGQKIYLVDTNGVKVSASYDPSSKDYSFNDMSITLGMGGDFYDEDFKKVSENGKIGLLDVINNKIIIPIEYDVLVDLEDKFKIITGGKNGKYGLIAFGGQIIIPLEYESIFVLNDYF